MRIIVENRRGPKNKGKDKHKEEDPDARTEGLYMPNYVYEECTTRFTAAKEENQKAEKSIFSDTGLMALTCRHDHVIFMVNLQDAGEKQYNALALINRLFKELPPFWRVGLLYDIGCRMHQTLKKVCYQLPGKKSLSELMLSLVWVPRGICGTP